MLSSDKVQFKKKKSSDKVIYQAVLAVRPNCTVVYTCVIIIMKSHVTKCVKKYNFICFFVSYFSGAFA